MTRNDTMQGRTKRGRPRKTEGEARSLSLPSIRVNPVEMSFIDEQASNAGLPLSTYVRNVLTQRRVAPAKASIDDKLLLELNRIGVNLNQQTAHSNSGRHAPDMVELTLIELREVLAKVGAAYDT